MELIPVAKGTDYLEVHPVALAEHQKLGWAQCEKREAPKGKPKPDPKGKPEPEAPKG